MKTTPIAALVMLMLMSAAGSAFAQPANPAAPAAVTAREAHVGGSWKPDHKEGRPTQRWNLDVRRGDDNSIRGRVSVADSPLLSAGNVEGKIDGHIVSGTISDDAGNPIATFTGTVTPNGMHGKYTDRTDEVGNWSWDGPPPE